METLIYQVALVEGRRQIEMITDNSCHSMSEEPVSNQIFEAILGNRKMLYLFPTFGIVNP